MTVSDPVSGPASDLVPGANVGRYIVVSRLGAGRGGDVFAAFDPELARQVALEVVRVHGDDDAATRDRGRLLREAQALARLTHRNAVTVYDVGVAGDAVYLATELVRGTDLRTWSAHAPRPRDRILEVLAAAGEGLWAAHRLGIVHGDFGAEHVRVGDDGRVCVAFGLAIEREADAAEDRRAWCAVAFEAIYGRRPSAPAIGRPPTVAAAPLAWHVPRWLRSILARGSSDELATMGELLAAFARGRARVRRIGVALACAAVVTVVALASLRAAPAPPCPVPTPAGWDRFDASVVERSFAQARPSYGAALAGWATGRLGDTREDWRRVHTEICEATWVRGEQSARLLDARMSCMRRAWDRIVVTATTLELADADVVEHAIELVDELPRPDVCRGETPLSETIDVVTPERRAVEQGLAEVHARRRLDRGAEIVRALDRLDPLVVELGDPRLRIEAMLLRGRMLDDRGEADAAIATLREAAVWAKSIDVPLLEAESWIALASAVGESAHDADEGRFYGGLALAAIERGGGDDHLRSRAEAVIGTVEHVAGDDARAEASFQSALDRRRAVLGEAHHLIAASLHDVGRVAHARGENERAGELIARAMAMRAELFGADHPSVAESAIDLALVRAAQGRTNDAVALAERALALERGDGTSLARLARAAGARPLLEALAAALEHGGDPRLLDAVRDELAALPP